MNCISLNYITKRGILQIDIANNPEMYYNKFIETNEREKNMLFDLNTLLIVSGCMIGAIAVILLVLYCCARGAFYKFMTFFVVDNGKTGKHEKLLEPVPAPKKHTQKSVSEPLAAVCTLIRKSDDRLRIIESDGTEKVVDAYYELVFRTRKMEELRVACSSDVYFRVPFDCEGSLTYRRNTLVRFRYFKNKKEYIISDHHDAEKDDNGGKLVIFKKTID
jgi:hypothetical protein